VNRRTIRLVLILTIAVALLGGSVARFGGRAAAAQPAVAVAVSDTPTMTATATPTSTATSTLTPTATLTATGTPSATQTITPTATAIVTGTTSPTATATSLPGGPTDDYFAEGYTGLAATNGRATFGEVLNLLNPSTNPVVATITYYIQGVASPLTVTRTVSATRVLQESVNTDVGPDKFVAAIVQSPQRLFVTRTITRVAGDGTRLDGSTTQAATAPARVWYFPEGYTGVTFQQYLTILNPSSVAANVSIVLAPQAADASSAKTLTLNVPALSRATANIRALNLDNPAKSVGMIINSDQPIVPERVIYFGDGSGSGKFGSTVTSGVLTAGTHLRVAYATSGGLDATSNSQGNQAFLTLLNPAASGPAVQVTAAFFDASGHSIGSPAVVNVAPRTRQTIVANKALGSAAVPVYSVNLTASGVIEVESAQYYGGSPNIGKHPGVDFPAQSSASSDVFLSDLSTRQADGTAVDRFAYIYNPASTAIQVGATYYGSNGSTALGTYSVAAGSITTVDVVADSGASVPPGPVGAEFKAASGSFIVFASGHTSDNLSATEDTGIPLNVAAGVPFP
jgi:hypothetical protein